jgi:hypothetical protein
MNKMRPWMIVILVTSGTREQIVVVVGYGICRAAPLRGSIVKYSIERAWFSPDLELLERF